MKDKNIKNNLASNKKQGAYSIPHTYDYEKLLREVHPNFCQRLIERAPTMTQMEILNCMLVRLHIPVKEAAITLAKSTSSIEAHRSHARIKLGIDRRQSLFNVLYSI